MIRNMVNENCRNRNNPWESSGFGLLTRVTSIDQIHFRAKRGGNDTESESGLGDRRRGRQGFGLGDQHARRECRTSFDCDDAREPGHDASSPSAIRLAERMQLAMAEDRLGGAWWI